VLPRPVLVGATFVFVHALLPDLARKRQRHRPDHQADQSERFESAEATLDRDFTGPDSTRLLAGITLTPNGPLGGLLKSNSD